jgi:hypothetical protein
MVKKLLRVKKDTEERKNQIDEETERLKGKDTQVRDAEEETETKKDRDSVRLIKRVNET